MLALDPLDGPLVELVDATAVTGMRGVAERFEDKSSGGTTEPRGLCCGLMTPFDESCAAGESDQAWRAGSRDRSEGPLASLE